MINACHALLTRLRTACPAIHASRGGGLLTAVETATHHQRLPLTELGRGLRSPALVKHNIKPMDRLLGNSRLGTERLTIFQAVVHWLLAGLSHWWIGRISPPIEHGKCSRRPFRWTGAP